MGHSGKRRYPGWALILLRASSFAMSAVVPWWCTGRNSAICRGGYRLESRNNFLLSWWLTPALAPRQAWQHRQLLTLGRPSVYVSGDMIASRPAAVKRTFRVATHRPRGGVPRAGKLAHLCCEGLMGPSRRRRRLPVIAGSVSIDRHAWDQVQVTFVRLDCPKQPAACHFEPRGGGIWISVSSRVVLQQTY